MHNDGGLSRRGFLVKSARAVRRLVWGVGGSALVGSVMQVMADASRDAESQAPAEEERVPGSSDAVTLFLCGDVMTGRGIDQVLPYPSTPRIYESFMTSAAGYVELAEMANGPIPSPVPFTYIWGDALEVLERAAPAVRIVNLETAVTTSDAHWPGKGINYRMHPKNIECITAAKIDCCVLANNHVLDWGHAGLAETIGTLRSAGIAPVGAGRDAEEAEAPAVFQIPGSHRVIVYAFGVATSGIPEDWAAGPDRSGVNLLEDLSARTVRRIADAVHANKRTGDMVVASIHWGSNWGYRIPRAHREFAHMLIDGAGVDVVHGHSSHHPRGVEVYRGRPILYSCGDFLNDYEGIGGYEQYRGDLSLMYFVSMDPGAGTLRKLEMVPMQLRRFRANRPSREDAEWLRETMDREARLLGTRVERGTNNTLRLRWTAT